MSIIYLQESTIIIIVDYDVLLFIISVVVGFFSYAGLHSPFLNNNCVDFRKFCYAHPKPTVSTVSVGAISGIKEQVSQIMEKGI